MLKKYIVVLVMALNMVLCKFTDARIQIDTNIVVLMIVVAITINVNTAKTSVQVCREIGNPNNVADIVASSSTGAFDLRKTCSSRFILYAKFV